MRNLGGNKSKKSVANTIPRYRPYDNVGTASGCEEVEGKSQLVSRWIAEQTDRENVIGMSHPWSSQAGANG